MRFCLGSVMTPVTARAIVRVGIGGFMTRIAALITTLVAVGCNLDAVDSDVNPGTEVEDSSGDNGRTPVQSMGGQSGSEDIYECIVAARTVVTDPTLAAQGAAVAAQVYLDLLAASYGGQASLGGDPQAVDVSFDASESVLEFVIYGDPQEGWEEGDPIPYDVDDGCPDRYEWDVVMFTESAEQLDELVATTAMGRGDEEFLFVTSAVGASDVTGTLPARTFDVSAATNPFLRLGFVHRGTGGATLDIDWWSDTEELGNPDFVLDDYGSVALTAQ